MKTIKQIADEIGVSKQAVQKRIAREPLKSCLYPYIDKKQGTKYIASIGEKIIIEAFSDKVYTDLSIDTGIDMSIDKNSLSIDAYTPTSIDTDSHVHSEMISILRDELQIKNDQIESQQQTIRELTKALENTTESLRAAQALHAGTIHQQLTDGTDPAGETPAENGPARGRWFWPFGKKKDSI